MNTSIILDLFLYFARFPLHEGVKSLFVKGASDNESYLKLALLVDNLSEHSLMPSVDNYVFGVSLEAVQARINKIDGAFMLIDYGQMESQKQNLVRKDSLSVAVTIAFKIRDFSADLIEHAICSDESLQLILQIRDILVQDQRERYFLKGVSDSHSVVPFSSNELSATGWSLVFECEGTDFLSLKKLSFN